MPQFVGRQRERLLPLHARTGLLSEAEPGSALWNGRGFPPILFEVRDAPTSRKHPRRRMLPADTRMTCVPASCGRPAAVFSCAPSTDVAWSLAKVIGTVSDSVVVLAVSASRPIADEPLVSPDATPLLGVPAAATLISKHFRELVPDVVGAKFLCATRHRYSVNCQVVRMLYFPPVVGLIPIE